MATDQESTTGKESGSVNRQRDRQQLWQDRSGEDAASNSSMHSVLAGSLSQDVGSGPNTRRWWTSREVGSLTQP